MISVKVCRILAALLLLVCMLSGCQQGEAYVIEIIVPAGSMEPFVYSAEEISPQENSIRIHAWAGLSDTEVVLKPVQVRGEREYTPTYLTQGMPVDIQAEENGWFQIGISVQNKGDKPITVSVKVENAELRIP